MTRIFNLFVRSLNAWPLCSASRGGAATPLALFVAVLTAPDASAGVFNQPEAEPAIEEVGADLEPVDLSRELLELLERLDHPRFSQRATAAQRIYQTPGLTVRAIETILREGVNGQPLSPEQRVRLDRVGREIFSSQPHGGLGIRFARQLPGLGVQIAGTVQNDLFPASKLLEADDIIVAVDGFEAITQSWLSLWIVAHEPGDVLKLTVLRGGEEIEVEAPLGDYEDLGNGRSPNSQMLDSAYQVLTASSRREAVPKIALSTDDLLRAAYGDDLKRSPRPTSLNSALIVGGVPQAVNDATLHRVRALHSIHSISLTGAGVPAVLPIDLRDDLIQRLARERDGALRRADQLESLSRSRADDADQDAMLRQADAARESAAATQERIEALRSAGPDQN